MHARVSSRNFILARITGHDEGRVQEGDVSGA